MKNLTLIIVLWCAGLLAAAQFAKIAVLLPEIRTIYPFSGNAIAWLLTLISLVGAILGGIAGSIANRIGQKNVLLMALFGGGLLSLGQALLPDFGIMAASRVLEGLSHLGIVVAAPSFIAQLSSDRWRGAAMSLWSTFFGVSFALFALIAIPLAKTAGVANIFQFHGGMMILVAIMLLIFLPDLDRPKFGTNAKVGLTGPNSIFAAYLRWPMVWPGIGWLFYTLTFVSMLAILPDQIQSELRGPTTTAMPLISIVVSLVAVPLLLVRFSATTIVMSGFALCAASITLSAVSSLPVVAVTLFGALGVVQGATFAAVAELNASAGERALGYGILAQTGNIGNLLGTPIFLALLGVGGLTNMLIAVFAVYLIGLFCLLVTATRLRDKVHEPSKGPS
ncbi:MAG: MFS transporter [Pseudomonadota bacterium]